MNDRADPRTDIGVALCIIVACLAVLWESRTIPPAAFDPLGSAPVPQGAASLIIVLSLVCVGRAIGRWRAQGVGEGAERLSRRHMLDALIISVLTVIFVWVMQLRATSFGLMTTVYLTAAIGWLVRFKPRLLPWIVLLALVIGFGCQYIFTRVFIVDLPGL